MKHGCSRTGRRSLKSPVLGNIFPYNQTLNNLILHILVAMLFTTNKHFSKCLSLSGRSVSLSYILFCFCSCFSLPSSSISLRPRVCVMSHLLIFCLSLLFVSYHPSILLAGWPQSCAVLELCSGRDKLSVALCSHTYPLLSQCIDCVHE